MTEVLFRVGAQTMDCRSCGTLAAQASQSCGRTSCRARRSTSPGPN